MTTGSRDPRSEAVWALFTDWCAALDREPLPARPDTVAEFLAANPAAVATQRRRVATINAVHRRAHHPPPGRADVVRRLLGGRRAARLDLVAGRASEAIRRLPTGGWPTGAFARRDALLLTLSTSGILFTQISSLRIGDVRPADDRDAVEATVDGHRLTSSAALVADPVSPSQVLDHWLAVRAVQHHRPSTIALAAYLTEPAPSSRLPAAPEHLPLFTALDRWGSCPLAPTSLRPDSIAAIVNAHLAGVAPIHQQRPAAASHASTPPVRPETPPAAIALDPHSFERGSEARRAGVSSLVDLPAVLDEVEARADRLLADLAILLEHPTP